MILDSFVLGIARVLFSSHVGNPDIIVRIPLAKSQTYTVTFNFHHWGAHLKHRKVDECIAILFSACVVFVLFFLQ